MPDRPACQAVGAAPSSAPGGSEDENSAHSPSETGSCRLRQAATWLQSDFRPLPSQRLSPVTASGRPRAGRRREPLSGKAPFALFASRGSCAASPSPPPRPSEELIVFRVEHSALSTDPRRRALRILVNGAVNIVNIQLARGWA